MFTARQKKIIKTLALQGPECCYDLAKSSQVAQSLAHKIIKDKNDGFVVIKIAEPFSTKKSRNGKSSTEFVLTFRGMIEYLNILLEEGRIKETAAIKNALRRNSQLDYPLFAQVELLETWLGEKAYEIICMSARKLKNYPPNVPLIGEQYSGTMDSLIEEINKGNLPLEWQTEILGYGFMLCFFEFVAPMLRQGKIQAIPNKDIGSTAIESYSKIIESLQAQLVRYREIKGLIEKQLSAN